MLERGFIMRNERDKVGISVVIVSKKGGKWRICVNYYTLYEVPPKVKELILFIDE